VTRLASAVAEGWQGRPVATGPVGLYSYYRHVVRSINRRD